MASVMDVFNEFPVYAGMALLGTVLFGLKMALVLMGGDADGGDIDIDADVGDLSGEIHGDAGEHIDSTAAFKLISLQSILAFFMGTGWMGLLCRDGWGMAPMPSLLVSVAFGTGMALFSAFLMVQMKKLNQENVLDLRTCIGSTARVYLTVPGQGQGQGQVQVNVQGKRMTLPAVASTSDELKPFTDVVVETVLDGQTLQVKSLSVAGGND